MLFPRGLLSEPVDFSHKWNLNDRSCLADCLPLVRREHVLKIAYGLNKGLSLSIVSL